MAYGGTIWQMLKIIMLKNPNLTVAEAGVIVTNIKLALKGLQC